MEIFMPPKPNFVDRHAAQMSAFDLLGIISELEIIYDATGNEKIMGVLQRLKTMQATIQATIRNNEIIWTKEDIQEILDHPHLFPHSVITWVTGYRDNELSS
jgi:hypothetical protein